MRVSPLRWWVLGAFVVSSALNYLDRQILPALAPVLRAEFHLSNADYGLILMAFSVCYALSSPLAGLFIDRVGLNRGIGVAVALWSAAGMATAWVRGFVGFTLCRAGLGIAQAAGVPASGKAIAFYLPPEERALGNAVSQIGMSTGAMLAPPLAIWLAIQYNWRAPFLIAGAAGLLWIPFWNWVARRVPPSLADAPTKPVHASELLGDRRAWAFVSANVLSMTIYTLWTNWTTLYLVQAHGLRMEQTALLAALPPISANLGGLAGGWLSMALMRQGVAAIPARLRVCLLSAVLMLMTAAIPMAPTPLWATLGICFSLFWSSAWTVNIYTIPLDIWSAARAAFAISLLTGSYGAMQAIFSPLTGFLIDLYGFSFVCLLVSVLPLTAWFLLRLVHTSRQRTAVAG